MSLPTPAPDHRAGDNTSFSSDSVRYQALFAQGFAGVAELDLGGGFVRANRRFCEIAGYSEAELLRLRFEDLIHPDDLREEAKQFDKLSGSHPRFEYERRLLRKDRSVGWAQLSISLVDSEERKEPSALAIAVEVTRRHAAEDAMRLSAENFRIIVDALDTGFCIIEVIFDESGQPVDYIFLEVNPSFEKASGPSRDGTGVGLAVVRRAAERMGGAVGVRPSKNTGATFWIELRRSPDIATP